MEERIAHIAGKNNERHQTVAEHLRNTSELASEYAAKIGLGYCGALSGLLHDIGKYGDKFFAYMERLMTEPEYKGKGGDHSTAGAIYVMELLGEKPSVMEKLTAQLIAMAIMWHHGGLNDVCDYEGHCEYLKRLCKKNDNEYAADYGKIKDGFHREFSEEEIRTLFTGACREVTELVSKISKSAVKKGDRTFMLALAAKFLFSCLIDADRYDTASFMDGRVIRPQQDNHALWEILASELEDKYSDFDNDSPINRLRGVLADNCLANASKPSGVYTLNCPTGSGKTLSSLRYALNHGKLHGKKRIFYIIPLISIIEQNSEIIKNILADREKEIYPEEFVLELHSAAQSEDMKQRGGKGGRDADDGELLAERMDYPIVITTMVRFLNTFFKGGTRNPRSIHNLADSVIVFDEVQSVPLKCIGMFNCLVNFLSEICGATVILSTATQPAIDVSHGEESAVKISGEAELSGCTKDIREKFKRVRFTTDMITEGERKVSSVEEVCRAMSTQAKANKSILCIFNTKKSAEIMYEAVLQEREKMFSGYHIYYLSANLCPEHRSDRITEIKDMLRAGEQVMVISTQLIEAGVDISFNVVFRALAGLDSMIQAAGRCNRNGEEYTGTVFLFIPDFEDLNRLTYIRNGQIAARYTINEFSDEEIDSQKAIETYFRRYFSAEKGEFLYPFKLPEVGRKYMYEALWGKDVTAASSKGDVDTEWRPLLRSLFGTTGRYFEAIDTAGIAVIVPYKEGKDIINELLSSGSYEEKMTLLKKAQRYTVNVIVNDRRQIGDFADYYDEAGVYILKEGFYDEKGKGLRREGKFELLAY